MVGLTLGAADPLDAVRAAIQRGEKEITVRPGRYFITPKDKKGDCYLELKGVSDVVIDLGGADLIGKVRTRFLNMERVARNVCNARCRTEARRVVNNRPTGRRLQAGRAGGRLFATRPWRKRGKLAACKKSSDSS